MYPCIQWIKLSNARYKTHQNALKYVFDICSFFFQQTGAQDYGKYVYSHGDEVDYLAGRPLANWEFNRITALRGSCMPQFLNKIAVMLIAMT